MTNNVKAVVFDLDGTLLDTAPDFEVVLNRLRAEESLPPLDSLAIRNTVSNGARALVTLAFGLDEGDEGFEELRQRLLDMYLEHLAVASAPFPGIESLLTFLRENHLSWGIATNKPELYTTPLVKALGLAPDCVICPDHVQNRKPDPESMHLAARLLDCDVEDIIYVGDHQRDIDCGRNAGCVTIATRYGYIDNVAEVASWQATHIVDHASDIIPLVKQYL